MLKASSEFLAVFILVSVLLMLLMAAFISVVIYRYQQKQNAYFKDMETLKTSHQNALLQSQVEIQEQTFENISQEIHDNISHRIALAKLYLCTLDFIDMQKTRQKINEAVETLATVIDLLKNLNRSLSSDAMLRNGLVEALEVETGRLQNTGRYNIRFSATGNPVFLNGDTELLIFRMLQEALHNIIKHADADLIEINLHYTGSLLTVQVTDDGKGFNVAEKSTGSGLQNIKKRARLLQGQVTINSSVNAGTNIKIEIPLHGNDSA